MRPVQLALAAVVFAALAACDGSAPDEMPRTGAEARQRAIDAGVTARGTGAEIQEGITHRLVQAEYTCVNGERLSVVFDNPRGLATIRMLDGTAVDLPQERAADGIWYRSGRYELRGRGNEATWSAPERDPTTCSAIG
ncbi:MAG: MliC family protein [Caulobacterales bacterium]|nr:MliC family protein [Caulobacterales bacterium]